MRTTQVETYAFRDYRDNEDPEIVTVFEDGRFELDGISYDRAYERSYGGYFFNIRRAGTQQNGGQPFIYHADCEIDEKVWLEEGDLTHVNNPNCPWR